LRSDIPEPNLSGWLTKRRHALPYLVDRIIAGKKALFRGPPSRRRGDGRPHRRGRLDLIDVDYESFTVFDVREAMLDVAPILHENLRTIAPPVLANDHPDKPTNIASHRQFAMGDVEQGFKDADVVIEREFETARYHQGYIEPHNATAYWNKDGHLSIWTSTQGLFGVRSSLAGVLDIPVSDITVNAMEIGGGFGGKLGLYLEPLAAVLPKRPDIR
jgi:CO/xanthine dehydrogenase Mo-binding subunit